MRKLRVSILLVIALLFLLLPLMVSTQQAKAMMWREQIQTVRWKCPSCVGPAPPCDYILGEWTTHCDGSFDGWGWEVGEACTYTQFRLGTLCPPE
jgi:hypothetical protein